MLKVFREGQVETLLPHRSTEYAFDLEPCNRWPYGRIHNPIEFVLRTWTGSIRAILANMCIQRLSLMVSAPIRFAKTKDGGFKPVVDYPTFNLVTVKNRSLIRLISKMINWVREATVFWRNWTSAVPITLSGSRKVMNTRSGSNSYGLQLEPWPLLGLSAAKEPKPIRLGRIVTRTGQKPAVFLLICIWTAVPGLGSFIFRSNRVFEFWSHHDMISTSDVQF